MQEDTLRIEKPKILPVTIPYQACQLQLLALKTGKKGLIPLKIALKKMRTRESLQLKLIRSSWAVTILDFMIVP